MKKPSLLLALARHLWDHHKLARERDQAVRLLADMRRMSQDLAPVVKFNERDKKLFAEVDVLVKLRAAPAQPAARRRGLVPDRASIQNFL